MKANINTVLVGERVVLVPYSPAHVPKYHEWMLSEELRALTASEPLSLEEEYEMQHKWQIDEDKLTFIILSRGSCLLLPTQAGQQLTPEDDRLAHLPMIGDVNLFLYGSHMGDSERPRPHKAQQNQQAEDDEGSYAEVEVMIAEPSFRRKGLAKEALQLMLSYATGHPQVFYTNNNAQLDPRSWPDSPLKIQPKYLVTRISASNLPSISLFEKLGFQVAKRVQVFDEVEMRFCREATGTHSASLDNAR